MRFWDIAVFIFIFNMGLALMTSMGLFGGGPGAMSGDQTLTQKDVGDVTEETKSIEPQNGMLGDLNWLVQNVRLVVSGIGMFLGAMFDAVTVRPMLINVMCSNMKCGSAMNQFIWLITGVVEFSYVTGVIQLITGRNIKQMQ